MEWPLSVWIAIIVVSLILLIFLLRGFITWYLKINENIRLLSEANRVHLQNRNILIKLYEQQGGKISDLKDALLEEEND